MLLSLNQNERDREIRAEDGARLDACDEVMGGDYWVTWNWRVARNGVAERHSTIDDLFASAPPVVWGRLPTGCPWRPISDRHSDRYDRLEAFKRYAHRPVITCSTDTLVEHARDLFDAGVRKVVVKVMAQPKYGIYFVEAPERLTTVAVRDALWDSVGWTLVHLEGVSDAFLLQAHVPMHAEYRIFVVGNEPVTGAARVAKYTPRDNRGEDFDPMLRYHDNRVPTELRSTTESLVDFARQVCGEVALEDPLMSEYVVDVALSVGSDKPLIVEFNGLCNAGLYACRPQRVVEALVGVAQRTK